MKELASFNAMVRKWADSQPARYRRSALAFGYRCDRLTHSFDQTLDWISKRSRKREGEGVSLRKLKDDLKVFEANGIITVERRRNGSRNMSSVYHVDFDKVIEAEYMGKRQRRRDRDTEYAAFLASLDTEPPEDAESPKHVGQDLVACPACQALPDDYAGRLDIHVANGGIDPWDKSGSP